MEWGGEGGGGEGLTNLQRNPGFTICQGEVKIISLNRNIVIPGFPV